MSKYETYEQAINKIYDAIYKEKGTTYDIVYSITFHESPLCVLDQLLNILTFNHMNNIFIICSINETVFAELVKIKLPSNILIHPYIRPHNMPMSWNTNLFITQMNNVEHVNNIGIKYNYFCMLASNELFVTNVDINNIKDNIIIKPKERKIIEPTKILSKFNEWVHYKHFMNNFHLCSFFIKNGFMPHSLQHEGLILPTNIMKEILDFYKKDYFYKKIAGVPHVILEEVFIPTYLNNMYEYNNYILTYRDFDSYSVSKEIVDKIRNNELNYYSVKRVPRVFDDKIRIYIRDIYMKYLNNKLNIMFN